MSKHAMTLKVTPEVQAEIEEITVLSKKKLKDVKALVTDAAMEAISGRVAILVKQDTDQALGFTGAEDVSVTVEPSRSLVDGRGMTLAESQRMGDEE